MDRPKRGEIWRIKLGHKRRGTELDADDPRGERPCLVVSADDYNDARDGLTIVPLTHYRDEKQDRRSLWAITIVNRDNVYIDPRNVQYPRDQRLRLWEIDEDGNYVVDEHGNMQPYKSIIDCSELWTVSALLPPTYPATHPDNDLCRNPLSGDFLRYGELKEDEMIRVDAALQVLIGGGIRYIRQSRSDLPYHEGDVLLLDLPILGISGTDFQQCLVVSSSAVDAIRERTEVGKPRRPFGHCTVVPLKSVSQYEPADRGVALVDVYPNESEVRPEAKLALCQEVYTVDWRMRMDLQSRQECRVGKVRTLHMDRVREALRDYLDLPQ